MCVKDGFYRGPTMLFICCLEAVVFLASIYSFYQHLRATGGKYSDVLLFHIAHIIFCFLFGVYHIVTFTHHGLCYCDEFNIVYVLYVAAYAWMLEIFLRYWKRVTIKPGSKREIWQLRSLIYSIAVAIYSCIYISMIMTPPCQIHPYAALMRSYEMGQQSMTFEAYFFICVPTSIMIGVICEVIGTKTSLSISQIFYWLIPSILMLKLTWKRNYLAFFGEFGSEEMSWQLNELRNYDSESSSRRNTISVVNSTKSIDFRRKSRFKSFFGSRSQDVSFHILNLLTQTVPLKSHLVVRGDVVQSDSFKHRSSMNLSGRNLTNTNMTTQNNEVNGGGGGKDIETRQGSCESGVSSDVPFAVIVEEDLRPSQYHGLLVSLIVSSVVLKPLQAAHKAHSSRIKTLLKISEPKKTGGLGDLEKQRQFQELKHKADELNEKYTKFLKYVKQLALPVAEVEGGYVYSFKATIHKKSEELALFTTNLNTHLTSLSQSFDDLQTTNESPSSRRIGSNINTRSSSNSIGSQFSSETSPIVADVLDLDLVRAKDSFKECNNQEEEVKDDNVVENDQGNEILIQLKKIEKKKHKISVDSSSSSSSSSSSIVNEGNKLLNDETIAQNEKVLISTVTFGAPTAHSLGFKYGGIRKVFNKLNHDASTKTKNPQDTLNYLQLRYEARAREAIVISQAVGALVISAIELITRCISTRNENDFKQFLNIGLLVHSVSLLSTTGNEEAMIDDFAGAYERCQITLKLTSPPLRSHSKTVLFNIRNNTAYSVDYKHSNEDHHHSLMKFDEQIIKENEIGKGGKVGFVEESDLDSDVEKGRQTRSDTNTSSRTISGSISSSLSSLPSLSSLSLSAGTNRIAKVIRFQSSSKNENDIENDETSQNNKKLKKRFEKNKEKKKKMMKKKHEGEEEESDDDDKDDAVELTDKQEKWKKLLGANDEDNDKNAHQSSLNYNNAQHCLTIEPMFKIMNAFRTNYNQHHKSVEKAPSTLNMNISSSSQKHKSNFKQFFSTKHQSKDDNNDDDDDDDERKKKRDSGNDIFGSSVNQSICGCIKLTIEFKSTEDYDWAKKLCSDDQEEMEIQIIPVLFNLGVNELQSIANTAGSAQTQTDINLKGFADLKAYHQDFKHFKQQQDSESPPLSQSPARPPVDDGSLLPSPPTSSPSSASSPLTPRDKFNKSKNISDNDDEVLGLLNRLEIEIEEEIQNKNKNVSLLLTSCEVARSLNAARTTSCKSAKDRTSVFQSLEMARIAQKKGWLHRSREQELLDELRGIRGVRLRNCESNIGRPKYSFNQLQLQALPAELRPPTATASGGKS